MKKNSANPNNPSWWKWGDPKKSFHLNDFPKLKHFLEEKWNKELVDDLTLPDRTSLIPDSSFTVNDFNTTFPELKPGQFSTDKEDRLRYAFGKSYHDAIRMFSPDEITTPDFILFPESHEDVAKILKQADKHQINVITFSGGSNVTGAVDVEHKNGWTCSLNMQRMNRLIEIDTNSFTATFEAGIFGPQLEKILNKQGFTLGHFPQSFEFSALGGWLATRSAGQESGLYGKIEDMVLGITAVTPRGTFEHADYPKHASGIDIYPLFIGSEGIVWISRILLH